MSGAQQSSSGVDTSVLTTLLQRAAQEPAIRDASSDSTWKGVLDGVKVKVYVPLSSKSMRKACGTKLEMMAESFLETAHSAAMVAQRLETVKKRGFFNKGEMVLAPAGPYIAKTITAKECKYLGRVIPRYVEHFQDCANSLLPRFYLVVRIDKGGRIKSKAHWVVTDHVHDLPLPVLRAYDLKGVASRHTKVVAGNEPLVLLKEGNLPTRTDQKGNSVPSLPQVSPWAARQLLMVVSVDCSLLEELKATNYSMLVLVCPARGEVDEMSYGDRSPRRLPYIRLDGPEYTLFAVLIDCLQEWDPAKVVSGLFSSFLRPAKATEALGLSPNRCSVRLHKYLEEVLGEGEDWKEMYKNQRWSDAVRTRAAQNLSPQAHQLNDRHKNMITVVEEQTQEHYGAIRPLSHALNHKQLMATGLNQGEREISMSPGECEISMSPPISEVSPPASSGPKVSPQALSGWDYPTLSKQLPASLQSGKENAGPAGEVPSGCANTPPKATLEEQERRRRADEKRALFIQQQRSMKPQERKRAAI
jgi:hypothetical protein